MLRSPRQEAVEREAKAQGLRPRFALIAMQLEIITLQYVRRGVRTRNSIRTQWEYCANFANRPLTSNGTTFKGRWMLRIKEEEELKGAKEAELKEEEEADLKEARNKVNKVAAERILKGKEGAKGRAGGKTPAAR